MPRLAAPAICIGALALCAGCLDVFASKPEDCSASAEVDDVDVDVDCELNDDGEYVCECDGGSTTEFTVDSFCDLDDDEQESIIEDECELDDISEGEGEEGEGEGEGEGEQCTPTFSYDFEFDNCIVDFDCGGGNVRQISCSDSSAEDFCDCTENGFGVNSFSNDGFCELVLAAGDGDGPSAEQVIVRSAACLFDDE
jgi:hypothetical protein